MAAGLNKDLGEHSSMSGNVDPPLTGVAGGGDVMQFPMDFPIKIMGRRVDTFADEIVAVVRAHAPGFDPATLEMRTSRNGTYLSVTATIQAESRLQLDTLYRALSSHPLVTLVL
jgi:putative lipoic acid-binding regulatory protein